MTERCPHPLGSGTSAPPGALAERGCGSTSRVIAGVQRQLGVECAASCACWQYMPVGGPTDDPAVQQGMRVACPHARLQARCPPACPSRSVAPASSHPCAQRPDGVRSHGVHCVGAFQARQACRLPVAAVVQQDGGPGAAGGGGSGVDRLLSYGLQEPSAGQGARVPFELGRCRALQLGRRRASQ